MLFRSDALVNFVKTGKLDFKSLADSIITDLIRIQIQQSVMPALSGGMSSAASWIGSMFGGSSSGVLSGGGGLAVFDQSLPILAGGKADGGTVMAGTSYLVGERGPEILRMGSAAGNIVPNNAIGQSITVNSNLTINAPGADAGVVARIRELMPNFIAENARVVTGVVNQAYTKQGIRSGLA